MYSLSAASLARRESAFLWPRPALSALPALFPAPLCVYIRGGGEGGEGRGEGRKKGNQERKGQVLEEERAGRKSRFMSFLFFCVCEVEGWDASCGAERHGGEQRGLLLYFNLNLTSEHQFQSWRATSYIYSLVICNILVFCATFIWCWWYRLKKKKFFLRAEVKFKLYTHMTWPDPPKKRQNRFLSFMVIYSLLCGWLFLKFPWTPCSLVTWIYSLLLHCALGRSKLHDK